MKLVQTNRALQGGSNADRRLLVNGLTLVSLGFSVLFLNSWDTPFVSTSIGLFWGTFFLIANWFGLAQALGGLRQKNDTQWRGTSFRSSTQR